VLEKDFVGISSSCVLLDEIVFFLYDDSGYCICMVSFFLLCSNSRIISAESLNFLESKINVYQLVLHSRAGIIYE
jgi:hypothetical protein